ncbi:PIR protein [Plasmodium vivax]|uniref:VIR protein n=1 Tax=Plasmodium vivax TaxID=5855 RepID=A0A564ZNE9_PLAVI|nr:PIR protein [Plasmodium vivax]
MSYRGFEYYENQGDIAKYNLLKNLSLYKLYDKLNQTLPNKSQDAICLQHCNGKLQNLEEGESKLPELCKSVCKVMLTPEDIDIFCSNSVCKRSCLYTNLWLYNHVLNITNSEINIDNFYQALKLIQQRETSALKECSFRNFKLDNDVFNIIKFIYELLYLYDDIKNNISGKYESNDELYCKHIKENFRYYNIIKKKCTIKEECKYHKELMNFKNQFSKDQVLDFIYKNCRYEKTLCKGDTDLSNDIPCLKKSENSVKITISDGDSNNVIKILYMSLLSFGSVMGILSMFYKFTPLGSWLRTKIGKKNNIEKHMNKENYDNLEYLQKIGSTYSDNKIYNIKYN